MEDLSNNITAYFILLMSGALLTIGILNLINLLDYWGEYKDANRQEFDACIKDPLITQTVFAFFWLLIGVFVTFASVLMIISVRYFVYKILKPFLKIVMFIYGPALLYFSILALINWDQVMNVCSSSGKMIISVSNVITTFFCFIVSLVLTIGYTSYEVFLIFLESILFKTQGSSAISNMFWKSVYKKRIDEDNEIIRARLSHSIN